MGLRIQSKRFGKRIATLVAVFALVAQPLYAVAASQIAHAVDGIVITNTAELRSAIENQADGQTWTIQAGDYGLERFDGITAGGQTGWYLPITANDLTITGVGNPTLYGVGYAAKATGVRKTSCRSLAITSPSTA